MRINVCSYEHLTSLSIEDLTILIEESDSHDIAEAVKTHSEDKMIPLRERLTLVRLITTIVCSRQLDCHPR